MDCDPNLYFVQIHLSVHQNLGHKVADLVATEFLWAALAVAMWQDHIPIPMNMLFPPPDTLFREAKDMAEVLWEVSLEIEGECPLLHVQADLLKDHLAGRRRDKPFLLLLSWALLGCSDVG